MEKGSVMEFGVLSLKLWQRPHRRDEDGNNWLSFDYMTEQSQRVPSS